MKLVLVLAVAAAIVVGLVWAGLVIKPAPFAPFSAPTADIRTMPLPANLPAPVERFYRQLYGDNVPLLESAVITGRGTMTINGITMPVRFRFTHQAGKAYRHYIETTLWGFPLLTVNEHYVDGTARLVLPFGVSEGPNINQGANLALWAESIWLPTVWLTDARAQWQAVDAQTARLVVPFEQGEETIVVRFDPQTNLITQMESMRFRDSADQGKLPWLNEIRAWEPFDGRLSPLQTQITWGDASAPWAVLTTEDIRYNADVTDYIRADGP